MKVVILAGGLGTRLSEETTLKPKPMVEIGGRPILWHIMKHYSHFGYNEFVICLGYMGYQIKEYFSNYFLHESDLTINLTSAGSNLEYHNCKAEPWKITLVDTGAQAQTGARVKRIRPYVDGPFMLTYGDGVSDVNIADLVKFHKSHGKVATMTSIRPQGRFGVLDIDASQKVLSFKEKPDADWINGGFFVLEPKVFEYLDDSEDLILEKRPLESLVRDGNLHAYKHDGFWKCMDTLRDKNQLEEMWRSGQPDWKLWS